MTIINETFTNEQLRDIVDGAMLTQLQDKIMARELLANREAQPVAEVVSKYGDPEAFGEREIRVLADLQKIPYDTKLFTAPPAVPHVTVIPEAATLTNINQLCPLDNNLSQTDFATGWNDCRQCALTHDGVPPVIKGVHAAAQGWNACRAAMPAQPVSQGGKLPEGFKLMPIEMTDEIAEAIALEARCCGGSSTGGRQ
ncbi:hypothetical protein [Serratia bockelmannii]|uniref:hypothetical protein n=1 Tax=Serratia bockelmannii TaxID=2703793 RepID=UPI00313DEAB7